MVRSKYVPERGDIIRITFDPTRGHEQAKIRPALVLSPRSYNKNSSLIVFCPITSKTKGYPFEVPLQLDNVAGVVLSDHVRSLDWQARKITKLTEVDQNVLALVSEKILLLIAHQS